MSKKKKHTTNVNANISSNPHVVRMINDFGDAIKLGFSEENWITVSRILKDISVNVSQHTMLELGNLWSYSYVENDYSLIETKINDILKNLSVH